MWIILISQKKVPHNVGKHNPGLLLKYCLLSVCLLLKTDRTSESNEAGGYRIGLLHTSDTPSLFFEDVNLQQLQQGEM